MFNIAEIVPREYASVVDSSYTYLFVSPGYLAGRNLRTNEVVGKKIWELWDKEVFESAIKPNIDKALRESKVVVHRCWFGFTSTKNRKYFRIRYVPLLSKEGTPDKVLILTQDLTIKKQMESRLNKELFKDYMTGAYNRRAFERDMDVLLEALQKGEVKNLCAVYIDLDNFKSVNDTLGHSIGDEVLRQVVKFIDKIMDEKKGVYRMGGDEFSVLMVNGLEEHFNKRLEKMLKKVESLKFPKGAHIGFSVGAVIVESASYTKAEILDYADMLMYSVKMSGKGQAVVKRI